MTCPRSWPSLLIQSKRFRLHAMVLASIDRENPASLSPAKVWFRRARVRSQECGICAQGVASHSSMLGRLVLSIR